MSKSLITVLLLVFSNVFMTFAWYGHLYFQKFSWFARLGAIGIVILSWCIALFEYALMIPANRIGYVENGGPYSLMQLKVLQEAITLLVFLIFTVLLFKNESIRWNHLLSLILILMAVYLMFYKPEAG